AAKPWLCLEQVFVLKAIRAWSTGRQLMVRRLDCGPDYGYAVTALGGEAGRLTCRIGQDMGPGAATISVPAHDSADPIKSCSGRRNDRLPRVPTSSVRKKGEPTTAGLPLAGSAPAPIDSAHDQVRNGKGTVPVRLRPYA